MIKMKRLFLVFISVAFTLLATAQLPIKNGFYRAKNVTSGRFITLIDDYGKLDYQSTDVDAGAIRTFKYTADTSKPNWDAEKIISNPASVLYSEVAPGTTDKYRFYSQGCDTKSIIGYYLNVQYKNKAYRLYASAAGLTKYMCDNENRGADSSYVSTSGEYRDWDLLPVTADGDNYFGMLPTISNAGKYYLTFYAAFPFSFYSSGMKAYYVTLVDEALGIAVWKEITGDVPASTPIIAVCSSASPSSNRLDLHTSTLTAPKDNKLTGVYFCRVERQKTNPHFDAVANDPETMRVLGVLSDGSIGMKKYEGKYIPKNTAYLTVPAGSPDEFKLMTQAEYDKVPKTTLVSSITLDKTSAELAKGETLQLNASLLPEDAENKELVWSTSDKSVATVSATGKVTAVGTGSATITATTADGSNLSATCSVTVYSTVAESITLSKTTAEIKVGGTLQLTATVLPTTAKNRTVTWSSSNTAIAKVNSNGLVTAVKAGKATITATTNDGTNLKATCEITVQPIYVTSITLNYTEYTIELTEQKTLQLKATVEPSNASNKNVTWKSSDTNVATVSNTGLVTFKQAGFAVITATANDDSGCFAECQLTATDAIGQVSVNAADAVIYDIQGRRVDNAQMPLSKGIYIINGKKHIVK